MEKRILLGSIIAVAILIGVSFTSVVSYGSVKSASALNSPLFNIRTNRAIGQVQKDISTDYLGHGEETNIHVSRIRRAEQVQKVVNIISKMSDRAFNNLVAGIILRLKNQEQMTDKDTSDVLHALYHIRSNPNVMKYYEKKNTLDTFLCGIETFEYITCFGFPCIINFIMGILIEIGLSIIGWLTSHTCWMNCNTIGCAI